MNPRDLVDVLRDMREKSIYHMPWVGGPSANHIALAKDRGGKQDLFTVSPALYKAVCELYDKLEDCYSAILDFEDACTDHGIKGGR